MDIKKAVTSLIPVRICCDFRAIVDALSLSIVRVKEFLYDITLEADPATATELLDEWHENEGLVYDSLSPIAEQQRQIDQSFSSAGGQDIAYLTAEINKVFPGIQLQTATISPLNMAGFGMAGLMMASDYPSWVTGLTGGEYPTFFYRVIGKIPLVSDLKRLENLLDRIMPLAWEPVFAVTIENLTPTAEAGLGMSGLMMAGRIRS